ncbi:GNAT family N-acetyltransferase [Planococcus sp. X10-3]|uniref:GNAT family N-acetyltransferase n=1 Tax=Planococcus sp. X10-3 TaxID=3061240 RepID=UPI003BB0A6D0
MKITHQEIQEDRDFIRRKVVEHNNKNLPEQQDNPHGNTSYIARGDDGEIIGGITGTYFWQHMHIDFLWVDPAHQGLGIAAKLMAEMEQYARDLNCRLITVETFSFQAPGFYRTWGYREYGVLEDHPAGHSYHYFEKRLTE